MCIAICGCTMCWLEVEEAIVKFTAVGTTYRIMQAVGRLGERQKVPVIRRSLNGT